MSQPTRPKLVAMVAAMSVAIAACGAGEPAEPEVFSVSTTVTEGRSLPSGDDAVSGGADRPGETADDDRSGETADDEAGVRAGLERYRQALIDRDPALAATTVTPETFDLYEEILELSLEARPEQLLDDHPLSVSFNVFASRVLLGDELLDVADGQRLFEIGVERGLVGDTAATIELESIRVDGDEAFGMVGGAPIIRFVRADGQWLVDVPYISWFAFDENEAAMVQSLTGRADADRAELFETLAIGYGSSWDEIGQPIR